MTINCKVSRCSFTLSLAVALMSSCAFAQGKVDPKVQPSTSEVEKKRTIPSLTGEELLCEIETENYSGVFALDTSKSNPLPFPLVEGARSPQWGPQHKAFSFLLAGLVWVGDREGHTQPAGLIPRNVQDFQMFWDPKGKAFALYTVAGWTKVFARSINFSEDLAAERLKKRQRINLKFLEKIVMKVDASHKTNRVLDIIDGVPPRKTELPFAPEVRPTQDVAFSPDASRFVMQVGEEAGYSKTIGRLWLFKALGFNVDDPDYSRETFNQEIASNDYNRFYDAGSVIPKATFVKELVDQNKDTLQAQPAWSPDGDMLAYSQIDTLKGEVWPYVLIGKDLEKNIIVSIPNYLPFAIERWAKRSVEVLFWGPSGDLFLIEGTRDKIYRAKKTGDGFVATVFTEVVASGKPTISYPVLRGEWLAYTMSLDDTMTIHLKNTRSGEERVLRIAVNGSGYGAIRSLNW